jgi:hypothetical protein
VCSVLLALTSDIPFVAAALRYPEFMLDSDELSESAPPLDYSQDGVDLTLIRWMLSLTPAERLEFLEEQIADILTIRALNARG